MKISSHLDGRIEFICKHNIEHIIYAPKSYKKSIGKLWKVHGCCPEQCCKNIKIDAIKGIIREESPFKR